MKSKKGQEIIDFLRGKETYFQRSFSQSGEDVIIYWLTKTLELKKFSWIDIGAHDPQYLSNTALFYRKGFRGINIEGDPSLIKEFHRKRPKDINLNILISDKSGKQDFYIIDPPTLNTLSEAEALRYKELGYTIKDKIEVESMTISEVIYKYCQGVFPDFLSLDAEGWDFEILKKIEWEKSFPKIICVEIAPHSSTVKDNFGYMKDNEMTKYILDKDYFIAAYTGTNTIFVKNNLI